MRLTQEELEIIKTTFRHYFGSNDHLWLFGSRVDDEKRGGDIDLYVETTEIDTDVLIKKKRDFILDLCELIGDQKIDVVLNQIHKDELLPIHEVAKKTGEQLL